MHGSSFELVQTPHREGFKAFDVVVVAASAGGISALRLFLSGLPACFPAPILIAQHLSPRSIYESCLDHVLGRDTPLPVRWAVHGEKPFPGCVYLAPQDRVTVLDPSFGHISTRGVIFRRSTPTANPLFASAARFYGSRTLAVVLSGALNDGAEGAAEVARVGGRVLVQSHRSAEFYDMPSATMIQSRIALAFDPLALAHAVVTLVMAPGASAWFRVGNARNWVTEG